MSAVTHHFMEHTGIGSNLNFWNAVSIWIKKPQVINRRLCGTVIQNVFKCSEFYDSLDIRCILSTMHAEKLLLTLPEDTGAFLQQTCGIQHILMLGQEDFNIASHVTAHNSCIFIVRDLLPKQINRYYATRELVIIDMKEGAVTFMPIWQMPSNGAFIPHRQEEIYQMKYKLDNDSLLLNMPAAKEHMPLQSNQDEDTLMSLVCEPKWLVTTLFPKLVSWSNAAATSTSNNTLNCVPIGRYNEIYWDLKTQYGEQLVKDWPECTDPKKFVYEDVAIAAYLITLWEIEAQDNNLDRKQSFVDLGCGNGVLVYLLTKYGYSGIGLDVRSRKIWKMFEGEANLKVQSITPSDSQLFPQYDWLIGNHSDELTPWIPVIAARSSYKCHYFVLPCCAFDFCGRFNERRAASSTYQSYLMYVQEVGDMCGFTVKRDILRIPSTKRTCFIGYGRTYEEAEQQSNNTAIQRYITERCKRAEAAQSSRTNATPLVHKDNKDCDTAGNTSSSDGCHTGAVTSSWASGFEARDSVERVKNCTKLPRDLRCHMVKVVLEAVLSCAEPHNVKVLEDGRPWNSGGRMPLDSVAKLFDKDTLMQLKNECGGLQTLLRNNHQLFLVQGGHVSIRDPTESKSACTNPKKRFKSFKSQSTNSSAQKEKFYKTQDCAFQTFHPDGCMFINSKLCNYRHTEDKLQQAEVT